MPTISFTPYAWSKFCFLRDIGPTEISAIGLLHPTDAALLIDVTLVEQTATSATVELEGSSICDYLEKMDKQNIAINRCARVWLHTHPGDCPEPSRTDIETYRETFGASQWSAFIILARGGDFWAQTQFGVGPKAKMKTEIAIDYEANTLAVDNATRETWREEYERNVKRPITPKPTGWKTEDLPWVGKKKNKRKHKHKRKNRSK